jgi:hypothetical protein
MHHVCILPGTHLVGATSWQLGLIGISGVYGQIGSFVAFLCFKFVAKELKWSDLKYLTVWKRDTGRALLDSGWLYTGLFTGIAERFFFTVLIALLHNSGIASGLVGWIAIKGQVHYRIFTEVPKGVVGAVGGATALPADIERSARDANAAATHAHDKAVDAAVIAARLQRSNLRADVDIAECAALARAASKAAAQARDAAQALMTIAALPQTTATGPADPPNLSRAYVGILSSLASLAFAIWGGYIWSHNVTCIG